MAASARGLRPLTFQLILSSQAHLTALPSGARFLATSLRRYPVRPTKTSRTAQAGLQLWRSYADVVAPLPKKPRRFRTLRWLWRLTYLSIFGGLAYVGYGIYEDRHPEPQTEPDPTKKTLVILGKFLHSSFDQLELLQS
jgi:NADH:ubiquinone reductase (non-electrogenic)